MRREEKRRKFHEALLNTLYPQSPEPQQEDPTHEHLSPSINVDLIPDDYGVRSLESDNEDYGNDGEEKLSRSQRKRIKKKKIKEDNARRRTVIGPLLPSRDDDQDTLGVRRNACDNNYKGKATEEGSSRGTKQNKVRQRREAKKLAKDMINTSVKDQHSESCNKSESCNDLETHDADRNTSKFEDCRKT